MSDEVEKPAKKRTFKQKMNALPASIEIALRERRLAPDLPVAHLRRHPDLDIPVSMSAADLEALYTQCVRRRSDVPSHIIIHDSETEEIWVAEREDLHPIHMKNAFTVSTKAAIDGALSAFAGSHGVDVSRIEIVENDADDGRYGIYKIRDWTPSTRYLKHVLRRAIRIGSVVIREPAHVPDISVDVTDKDDTSVTYHIVLDNETSHILNWQRDVELRIEKPNRSFQTWILSIKKMGSDEVDERIIVNPKRSGDVIADPKNVISDVIAKWFLIIR